MAHGVDSTTYDVEAVYADDALGERRNIARRNVIQGLEVRDDAVQRHGVG